LREDKEKLVPSVASEEIVGAKAGGDDFNDLLQSSVAGRVSSGVVDLFEMIDVDERDGELVAVSFGAYEFECEALVDAAAVECAGDVVVQGLRLNDRNEFATEHEYEEEANDTYEYEVDDECRGLEAGRLSEIIGNAVEEGNKGAAHPKQGVGGHQNCKDVQDGPLTCLSKKFDGDETAGEEEHQGDDGDSGTAAVVYGAEVLQQKESDSDRGPEQVSCAWAAKEEQNPTIKQHKCRKEQKVHNDDRDEAREATSYYYQDTSEKA